MGGLIYFLFLSYWANYSVYGFSLHSILDETEYLIPKYVTYVYRSTLTTYITGTQYHAQPPGLGRWLSPNLDVSVSMDAINIPAVEGKLFRFEYGKLDDSEN